MIHEGALQTVDALHDWAVSLRALCQAGNATEMTIRWGRVRLRVTADDASVEGPTGKVALELDDDQYELDPAAVADGRIPPMKDDPR